MSQHLPTPLYGIHAHVGTVRVAVSVWEGKEKEEERERERERESVRHELGRISGLITLTDLRFLTFTPYLVLFLTRTRQPAVASVVRSAEQCLGHIA